MARTTNNNNNFKKITQGRQKIEIKKIDNLSRRQVTFSKRRAGLFKKAGELCILTGSEVAILAQSLGKRVFCFGHPSVDAVVNRYTIGTSMSEPNSTRHNFKNIIEHKTHYTKVSKELEAEKKRKEMIEESKKFYNGNLWWNEPVDNMGLEELEQYMASLEELKKKVITRADELMMLFHSSSSTLTDMNNIGPTMATSVGCHDFSFNHQSIATDQYCTSMVPSYGSHDFGNGQL